VAARAIAGDAGVIHCGAGTKRAEIAG